MNRRLYSPLIPAVLLLASCADETGSTRPSTGEVDLPALAVAAASNTWTPASGPGALARMPTPRSFLAGGVANNSLGQPMFYAMGGVDPNTGPVRTVEAYNFVTNRWTSRAGLPVVLSSTHGVVNIGGKLYLSGGFFTSPDGHSGTSRALYVYDPGRNTWTRKADMPRKTAQGISGEINGKLYVLTGSCQYCPNRISRYLYRYDPVTNSWSSDLPWSPNAHVSGAGAVINGKFYVAGGRGTDGRVTNKLDVYDPVANSWTTLAPMPTARAGMAAARLQNKLYVIGNASVDPGEPQGQVEAYNPVTNGWTIKASMGGAGRGDLAAGRVTWQGQSHILAVGGTDVESSGPGDVNQAYTP